jgi:23S rRNA pseudouridine1911/1915/1917 synthase
LAKKSQTSDRLQKVQAKIGRRRTGVLAQTKVFKGVSTKPILTPNRYALVHTVDFKNHGTRLDHFLKKKYRKRSRAQLQKAIHSGCIRMERSTQCPLGNIKPSSLVLTGDKVFVISERKGEPEVSWNYEILYEDEAILVINKPAPLPVHPAGRYFFHTLLMHLKSQQEENAENYFLVHRLDKETSGVLILAKHKTACAHLTKQFAQRKVKKQYLAIVHGTPPPTFSVTRALKRSTHSLIRLKMMVSTEEEGAQPSETSFQTLETRGRFSILSCFPKTGRQHQIRIHLESEGFPIVGDKLYGMPESLGILEFHEFSAEMQARLLIPRHALHAASLEFLHPVSQKPMQLKASLPEDLKQFLDSAHFF